MAQIGVVVQALETPPNVANTFNTGNAFMVGFADWGPIGASGIKTPAISLAQAAAQIGPPNGGSVSNSRTSLTSGAGNATLYDSADAFFREEGTATFISRVVGLNPTFGSLNLQDSSGATAMTLTAAFVGAGSSGIYAVVTLVDGTGYTLTLQDSQQNVLAQSPTLTNTGKADAIAWALGTNLVTISAGNSSLPAALVSPGTALSTGSDNRLTATLASWSAALNGFGDALGPGQVLAPGQTNTALPGIWQALGTHASNLNRIALIDGTDGLSASAAIAEVTNANLTSAVKDNVGIWTGNLQIPGIVSGTTRIVPPSPVVAALCARVDAVGNPNLVPAGINYPLNYVSGLNTTYTGALSGDIANMNNAGINVFASVFQTLQNYGFVSAIALPTSDPVYWQLDHCRLRMALVAQSQIVGQGFLFAQVDGQGFLLSQFSGALQGMLQGFYAAGALYGQTPSDAFVVDTSAGINTPDTLAAGQLQAAIGVRMSPFAQLVLITIDVVPITQNLNQVATGG